MGLQSREAWAQRIFARQSQSVGKLLGKQTNTSLDFVRANQLASPQWDAQAAGGGTTDLSIGYLKSLGRGPQARDYLRGLLTHEVAHDYFGDSVGNTPLRHEARADAVQLALTGHAAPLAGQAGGEYTRQQYNPAAIARSQGWLGGRNNPTSGSNGGGSGNQDNGGNVAGPQSGPNVGNNRRLRNTIVNNASKKALSQPYQGSTPVTQGGLTMDQVSSGYQTLQQLEQARAAMQAQVAQQVAQARAQMITQNAQALQGAQQNAVGIQGDALNRGAWGSSQPAQAMVQNLADLQAAKTADRGAFLDTRQQAVLARLQGNQQYALGEEGVAQTWATERAQNAVTDFQNNPSINGDPTAKQIRNLVQQYLQRQPGQGQGGKGGQHTRQGTGFGASIGMSGSPAPGPGRQGRAGHS